ncbi:MAG: thiamine-phosphate kinase [Dehalococcoidia bacterium]|nr:thiamine-phosphate kinase [Dehalococcoidia bacterium]
MKLQELGEFKLTKLISEIIDKSRCPECDSWQRLSIGPGDDAAAWQSNNYIQLATTDTMVQDVHFDLDTVTWEELGWKALAVSLSDIAAMGGIPQYALVSLSLPVELEVEYISRLIESMTCLASKFETAIAGGNLTSAPNVVITTTLIGYSRGEILKRSTACAGDHIAVTGYLGASAAGLRNLLGKTTMNAKSQEILRRAHLHPIPRIKEGQALIQQGIRTAIDISDGLIADLNHICESSKLNAWIELEQVPVHPLVKLNFPDYQELALCGGEDYELLFTADKNAIDRARQVLSCPVTVIGEITEKSQPEHVALRDKKGNITPHEKEGWNHFGNGLSRAKLT